MQTSSDSVNDCVSQQRPQSNLTQKAFLDWLESLPSGTTFCDGLRSATCPIAKFLGRSALPNDESLPKWAITFMDRYDTHESTSLESALAIARNLEDALPAA